MTKEQTAEAVNKPKISITEWSITEWLMIFGIFVGLTAFGTLTWERVKTLREDFKEMQVLVDQLRDQETTNRRQFSVQEVRLDHSISSLDDLTQRMRKLELRDTSLNGR